MDYLKNFWNSRGRRDKILIVTGSVIALLVISSLLSGTDSSKKSKTTAKPTTKAATTEATTSAQPKCEVAPSVVVKALNDAWKKKGTHVARAWMVKSGDKGHEPMFENGTVYLISANVKPSPGIVVFGFDEEMTKKGGGFAVGIDAAAKASSNLGDLVSPENVGLSEDMDGYQTAYDCAGKG